MAKIEKLKTESRRDEFGNIHGLYYPTKSQLMDKINEIIDVVNELKKVVIMDYEKKYKEALQMAKHALDCDKNGLVNTDKPLIMSLFSELKESEDERIRKVIYGWIYNQPSSFFEGGFSKKEMLAWLEKQGEQKPFSHKRTSGRHVGIYPTD